MSFQVVYCALTDFQRSVYQTVLDTEDVMLILRSSDKCDCQSGRTRRSCCYKVSSRPAGATECRVRHVQGVTHRVFFQHAKLTV